MSLKKFIPFVKVDAAKREVYGIVTAEVKDKDGETCRYEPTKKLYQAWSGEFQKATGGESLGNLREMHQLKAAGRGILMEFRDEDKEIFMGFKVVDDAAWTKVVEKVYTGFSQGGEYVDGPDVDGFYTARPSEISLVDNPCLGVAHYSLIRADGAVEMVKIRSVDDAQEHEMEMNAATKAYIDAQFADLAKTSGPGLSLAKKATIHAHLKKAMEHHQKCGEAMAECMKAMGHEGEEPDENADPEKAAKARKAFEAAGLTGAALEKAVSNFTGKAAPAASAEEIGAVVESKLAEMLKAMFGREETVTPAVRQTVIPVTKTQDGLPAEEIAKLRQEIEDLKKATTRGHDPDGALALAKADKGTLLTNDEALRLGIIR
jgi:hypothetical protein